MSTSLPVCKIGLVLMVILLVSPFVYPFMSGAEDQAFRKICDNLKEKSGLFELPENYTPPVMVRYRLRTYTYQETEIVQEFRNGSEEILYYAYDIDSDGNIEYITRSGNPLLHQFGSPGKHTVTIYAIDNIGEYGVCTIIVEVLSGSGKQEMLPYRKPLSYAGLYDKKTTKQAQTDDSATYVLMYAQEAIYNGYFNICAQALNVLDTLYNIDTANIYFISEGVNTSENTHYLDDTVFVDLWDDSGVDALDSAANFLYSRMGSDDRLIIINSCHGSGQYDSSVYEYGDVSILNCAPYAFPYRYEVLESGDEDIEFTEEDAPICYFWSYEKLYGSCGMYEWTCNVEENRSSSYLLYRTKLVSTYTDEMFYVYDSSGNIIPDSIEIKTDNDIWVEKINQLCKGDLNMNCKIDSSGGETADWDNDGIPPVDTNAQGELVFDEDDWDTIYLLQDDYHRPYLFDSTLDSIADYSGVRNDTAPEVHSSDYDNDGIITGIDWNDDGDITDSVGVHEKDYGLFGVDTVLSYFIDSLSFANAHLLLGHCYSGGYIENVLRENVIITTSTTKGTVSHNGSLGGGFVLKFVDAMSDDFTSADVDSNGCVSIVEAFNEANLSDQSRAWYDDNGDGVASPGKYGIPSQDDGWLGLELSWSDDRCDSCLAECVAGDVNHTCYVDISDLVYLYQYLYESGSDPVPMQSGDVTGTNCVIDISDYVRIYQWLYGIDTTAIVCGCAE